MTTPPASKPDRSRFFYTFASATLLVLTFIGFKFFYLKGMAFPGRPLTPPIRTLLISHGILMTTWMLLSVVQPLLVALRRKRVHMTVGIFASVLSVAIVIVGYLTAINAARVNPPDLKLFGLDQKQFLTVPLTGVVTFAGFVITGIACRRRPEMHRPMMLMASLSAVSAAMGRMPALNDWYAGTQLEVWFSAFLTTIVLGGLLLAIKCALERRFDRWFAGALGALALICVATSFIARTDAWVRFATMLMR